MRFSVMSASHFSAPERPIVDVLIFTMGAFACLLTRVNHARIGIGVLVRQLVKGCRRAAGADLNE